MALATLAAQHDKPLDGFGLFGTVKETGVDDEGLSSFYSQYFSFPLYRDEKLEFYDAMGGRKMKARSFLGLIFGYRSMNKRFKAKKIEGNMKGEGLVQGGVIVFGKDGKQRYVYEEDTGSEIPIDDILAAVNAVKEEK